MTEVQMLEQSRIALLRAGRTTGFVGGVACLLAFACGGSEGSSNFGSGAANSGGSANAGGAAASSAGGSISVTGGSSAGGSSAGGSSAGGSSSGGSSGGCGSNLTGTIRDFKIEHPDFEFVIESDPGIVLPDLGSDGKPVYAGQAGNPTTNGQAAFDQWYRDVPGTNQAMPFTLPLTQGAGGVFTYDNSNFFPIDGQLWGDEGNPHNYHFTFELRTKFQYNGGETFTFTGDDDLFTFINNKLAIDLGGVHGALTATIDLDAQAAALGISKGGTYSLDFFFAERHTTQSNFRVDTTLTFVDCGPK
jgi:fibro-slime domain-containing protein